MYWKHFKILLTLLMAVLLMAPIAQAQGPYIPNDFIVHEGVVNTIEVYAQKEEFPIQTQSHHPSICRIPVDDPTTLYILTTPTGKKYILDWGPEWYIPSSCLTDSWVCAVENQPAILGLLEVGYFDCDANPMTVLSTNYLLFSPLELEAGIPLPLMTSEARDAMVVGGGESYVFGRPGDSQIIWLTGPSETNKSRKENICWDKLDEDGSIIVWETETYWWRGEAPPFGYVPGLSCTINE